MKIVQPGGHLDQMMRQTRNHHVQLSSMADSKASTLITVSSLLITLAAPHFLEARLKWPVIILSVCCLATIALAIYTVMPKIKGSRKVETSIDIRSPRFNLLFFGDFTRLDYSQFEAAMEEVMNDAALVYQAQVREVYTLGTFLANRKYRTLRWAYLTFILGLIASSLALFLGLSFA